MGADNQAEKVIARMERREAAAQSALGLTNEQWFALPVKLRQRWWIETEYGARAPSDELLAAMLARGG